MGLFIICCFLWLVMGLAVACLLKDTCDDFNPLWKIPLTLLGPISFVVAILIGIRALIRDYIQEVKDYYERKSLTNPRKNKFKRSAKYGEEYYEEET